MVMHSKQALQVQFIGGVRFKLSFYPRGIGIPFVQALLTGGHLWSEERDIKRETKRTVLVPLYERPTTFQTQQFIMDIFHTERRNPTCLK